MKESRKTKYTKMVIHQSLLELLKRKPLNKITVKELTELADINRSTFYRYYETMEHLIEEVEVNNAKRLIAALSIDNYLEKDFKKQAVNNFFNELCCNPEICFWILDDNVTGAGKRLIHDETEKAFVALWVSNKKISETQAHYFFEYIFEGAMGQIVRWYKNRDEISLEDLKEIFNIVVQNTIGLVH